MNVDTPPSNKFTSAHVSSSDTNIPTTMPCDTTGHFHLWPQSGPLDIKRCERYCGYCVHPRQYASTTTLRAHVITHHTVDSGSHPNVTSVSASRIPRASYDSYDTSLSHILISTIEIFGMSQLGQPLNRLPMLFNLLVRQTHSSYLDSFGL